MRVSQLNFFFRRDSQKTTSKYTPFLKKRSHQNLRDSRSAFVEVVGRLQVIIQYLVNPPLLLQ